VRFENRSVARAAAAMLACTSIVAWRPHDALAAGPPDDTDRALPCRPTIACTADIVPPGALEIEVGYIRRRLAANVVQGSTPLLLKLTIASWIQVQLGSNGWIRAIGAPMNYFDNVEAGLKFHLVDQHGARPSLALSGAIAAPTFASQLGYTPAWDVMLVAYATRDFGWLHADANAGLNVWNATADARWQPWGALALSGEMPNHFGAMLEGYVFGDATPWATRDAGVLTAVTWSPRAWLTFDVGADVGLIPSVRSASLFAGLTFVPIDLWDTPSERRRRAEALARAHAIARPVR
jgi:hypothetical protein